MPPCRYELNQKRHDSDTAPQDKVCKEDEPKSKTAKWN